MVNFNIIKTHTYLVFPAKKIVETYNKNEGKGISISDFTIAYENLRKAGVFSGNESVSENIIELNECMRNKIEVAY